jgi:hypothetical protein
VGVEPTIRPAKGRIAGFEGREDHRTPFASAVYNTMKTKHFIGCWLPSTARCPRSVLLGCYAQFSQQPRASSVIRQTPLAAPREEFWARQKYNSFIDYPSIAMKLRRAATPELASWIQDALRRRNELAPYARREIYRELANYLQSEISPFPDELVEILSDEQYLINAAGVLFRDQRLSLRN